MIQIISTVRDHDASMHGFTIHRVRISHRAVRRRHHISPLSHLPRPQLHVLAVATVTYVLHSSLKPHPIGRGLLKAVVDPPAPGAPPAPLPRRREPPPPPPRSFLPPSCALPPGCPGRGWPRRPPRATPPPPEGCGANTLDACVNADPPMRGAAAAAVAKPLGPKPLPLLLLLPGLPLWTCSNGARCARYRTE